MDEDLATVVDLLERWRDGGTLQRLGVATEATRAIRALSPDRKRALAAEVAERVAPQLVPQIRAEDGDLSSEQVAAVVDLIRRADREQLDDLVTAIRTGDVDGGLAIVDDALEAVDAVVPPPPPAPAGSPPDGRAEQLLHEAEQRMDDVVDDTVVTLDGDGDSRGDGDSDGDSRGDGDSDSDGDSRGDGDSDSDGDSDGAGDPALDEVAATIDEDEVRAAAEAAAAARAVQWADTSATPSRPPVELPEVTFDIQFDDVELPDPTVEGVAPLAERRHELPGAAATDEERQVASRDRDVPAPRRSAGTLAAAPTPGVVAAITATADGYRRRRAALAALREGRLGGAHVEAVVDSMARPTDRVWVAGAAVDAGLLDAAAIDRLDLSPAAARRLRHRLA